MQTHHHRHLDRENGQSLLEVAMALGVIMVVITALALVTLSGLRNSEFSQNQTQATKLAEDARDSVKTIRDRNSWLFDQASCTSSTLCTWADYWRGNSKCSTPTTGCNFILGAAYYDGSACQLNPLPSPIPTSLTSNPCLKLGNQEIIKNKFQRTINIITCDQVNNGDCTDISNKRVTVTVSWQDSAGQHQSNLVSILRDL